MVVRSFGLIEGFEGLSVSMASRMSSIAIHSLEKKPPPVLAVIRKGKIFCCRHNRGAFKNASIKQDIVYIRHDSAAGQFLLYNYNQVNIRLSLIVYRATEYA